MQFTHTLRNQQSITLHLKRNTKKNIIIRPISPNAISLNIPPHLTEYNLKQWLLNHDDLLVNMLTRAPMSISVLPDNFWFKGRLCRHQNHLFQQIEYDNGVFCLPKQSWPHLKNQLRHYFYHEAKEWLLYRLERHAYRMRLTLPNKIALSNAKTFWGVCRSNSIRLNWRLIGAPDYVADYICVHELCHLIHRNHSPHFWTLVNQSTLHTAAAKIWLKQYGRELFWLD